MTARGIAIPYPAGLLRLALRLPIRLYRLHLGWLLGDRFLLLVHRGRKSGRRREVVLEVVGCEPDTGAPIVAAGWGERADWFQNVLAHPLVQMQVGARRATARAIRLGEEAATAIFRRYGREHPVALRLLGPLLLNTAWTFHPQAQAWADLAARIPLVALRPTNPAATRGETLCE